MVTMSSVGPRRRARISNMALLIKATSRSYVFLLITKVFSIVFIYAYLLLFSIIPGTLGNRKESEDMLLSIIQSSWEEKTNT